MDLLFKRYASPLVLLDEMIRCGRFSEFIGEFLGIYNDEIENETLWEYYLHHPLIDKSFDEFKRLLGVPDKTQVTQAADKSNFEATLQNSMAMLEGFVPED